MLESDVNKQAARNETPPRPDYGEDQPASMTEEEAGEALRRMGVDPEHARARVKKILFGETSAPFPVKTKPVIAVLPFSIIGGADDGVVLDLSCSINERLSRFGQVVVRPAGSVQSLLYSTRGGVQLGRRLGADFVLSGDVLREGQRILATAHLINVHDGAKVWNEHCGGSVRQIFAVENRITEKLVERLNVRLSDEELGRLLRSHSENPDAYQKYRLARFHLNLYNRRSLDEAIRLFTEARDLDPGFALSHSGLADCYIAKGIYNMATPEESFGRGLGHAVEALRLDPNLAEAYASLGYVCMCYGWDWRAAKDAFGQAISLNANCVLARQGLAHLMAALGEFDAAKAEINRALELDPVSPIVSTVRGFVYYYAGDFEESVRSFRQAKSVNPKFDAAYYGLTLAHEQQAIAHGANGEDELSREMLKEAGCAARLAKFCSGRAGDKIALAAHCDALSNHAEKASKALSDLEDPRRGQDVSPFHVAAVYVELGMPERAIEYLEAGFRRRDQWLVLLNVEPRFRSLCGHRRFEKLIRRLNFPSAGRSAQSATLYTRLLGWFSSLSARGR